jgi:hypothetical protein
MGIAVALALAALGIFFGSSTVYAYILIVVAVIIVGVLAAYRLYNIKPRVFGDSDNIEKILMRIYQDAADHGGRLLVTHIRPYATAPSEDFALKYLRNVKKHLEYQRFIFVEDRAQESEWIKNTFGQLDEKIDISVYSLRAPPIPSSSLWRVLPRANILLYTRNNKHISLVGLDRLMTSDPRYKRTNFAIVSRRKDTFEVLLRYFHELTTNKQWLDCDKSLAEYERDHIDNLSVSLLQSVLLALSELCYTDLNANILNCGLFGRRALEYAGVIPIQRTQEHEADVDVVLIVKPGKKDEVKQCVRESFRKLPNLAVVWGDDEGYFYFYRESGKLTIDIEVLEKGTGFYVKHPILGHSVFAFYFTLYKQDPNAAVRDLIHLPKTCSSRKDRMKFLLTDRKGIEDFASKLRETSDQVDPRRVVSQVLRNLAWAASGIRHYDPWQALETLQSDSEFAPLKVSAETAAVILTKSTDEMKKIHSSGITLAKQLLNDCKSLLKNLT